MSEWWHEHDMFNPPTKGTGEGGSLTLVIGILLVVVLVLAFLVGCDRPAAAQAEKVPTKLELVWAEKLWDGAFAAQVRVMRHRETGTCYMFTFWQESVSVTQTFAGVCR
jgi:hypothetical protein